jgi:DNA polymerase III subunit gamma/tau
LSTEVLYRKWRPQRFSDVTGQEQVTRTLKNAITFERIGHAYLFAGPRGTGKTSVARIFARAINCDKTVDGEACEQCEPCRAFATNVFDFIEIDGASNRGVDDADRLRKNIGTHPTLGRFRVYLIDEVHMLSKAAFNALLKTLEEPPAHVVFILATTEAHDLLPTVTSRCQRFDFRRHSTRDTVTRLAEIARAEEFQFDETSMALLARAGTGSLRDSINLMEQVVASHGRAPTIDQVQEELGMSGDARALKLVNELLHRDAAAGLATIAAVVDDGVELKRFLRDIREVLRAALLVAGGARSSLDLGKEELEPIDALATGVGYDEITRALKAFGQVDLKDASNALPLEVALSSYIVEANQRAEAASARSTQPQSQPVEAVAANGLQRSQRPTPFAQRPVLSRPSAPRPTQVATEGPLPPLPGHDSELVANVRARWRELFEEVKRRNTKASGLINGNCDVCGYADGVLTFGFRHQFHAEQMVNGGAGGFLVVLQDSVRALFGEELRVRCEHRRDVREPDRKAAGARAEGGHLVREAVDMGGKVVENTSGGPRARVSGEGVSNG